MATEPAGTAWSGMVVIGRVARPHGRRGEVIVNLETDFPEQRFRPDGIIHILVAEQVQALRVTDVRFQSGRPVIAVDGVDSISRAEGLVGHELRVPQSEQQPLPEGTYYEHALIGCEVRTVEDTLVGTVVSVQGVAGAHRLIVEPSDTDADDRVDIPLAEPICVRVELDQKRVTIDPPFGLLELNRRPEH